MGIEVEIRYLMEDDVFEAVYQLFVWLFYVVEEVFVGVDFSIKGCFNYI